jgi:hypothetical protein
MAEWRRIGGGSADRGDEARGITSAMSGTNTASSRRMSSSQARNQRRVAKRVGSTNGAGSAYGAINPTKVMMIHLVAEPTGVWAHTHGLQKFGLPELEIRDVPTFLSRPAGDLLNAVADYLLNSGKTVRLGELLQADGFGLMQFVTREPKVPFVDHYDHERWTLVSAAPEMCACDVCDARRKAEGSPMH